MNAKVPTLSVGIIVSLLAVSLLVGGCGDSGSSAWFGDGQGRSTGKTSDPISRVVCFYPQTMFQSFDKAGDRKPEGFKFTLYLLSRQTGKGILADGVVHVEMYRLDRTAGARPTRTLIQDWSVATSGLPHSVEPKAMGYAYVPYLHWGDADVYGNEIEIAVRYESPDGRFVQSQTTTKKVPPRDA